MVGILRTPNVRYLLTTALALFVALALLLGAPSLAHADGDDHGDEGEFYSHQGPYDRSGLGETPYDSGLVFVPGHEDDHDDASELPHPLAISGFSTNSPGLRWATSVLTVEFCTRQSNRPPWISADAFRQSVVDAAEMWNEVEAAVGIVYTGDCQRAGLWQSQNELNEIGWDDRRGVVRSPSVAVTQGRWFRSPGTLEFAETDIILSPQMRVPEQCFHSILRHELGHALGFGHSDQRGDLMYASFNSNDASSCAIQPSDREVTWLQELYGVKRAPVIAPAIIQSLPPGTRAEVFVAASDPDGDSLMYAWRQVDGPAVDFRSNGASISFVAPDLPGAALKFHVEVRDRYLKRAETAITAMIGGLGAQPGKSPSLEVVELAQGGGRTTLGWEPVTGGTFYRICTTDETTRERVCQDEALPAAQMSWSAALASGVDAQGIRRMDGARARSVTAAACNAFGCSDFGPPIKVGGVTSAARGVDFDVVGMGLDYAPTVRFTVGGVFNVSGASSRFVIYAGTADDPLQMRVRDCGILAAGTSCIGLLGPGGQGHLPVITAVSERSGEAPVHYRLQIR